MLEDSTPEEHLSIESVLNNFKYQYEDLTSRIVSYSFGYSEIFEELIDVYKEQGGEVIDDLSSLYCDFIDFLTLI